MSFFTILGLMVLFIVSFFYILIHFYHAYKALNPKKLKIQKTPIDYGMEYRNFNVSASDGCKIKGWYILSNNENKGTVIVSHNLAANKSKMLPYARFLYEEGFNIVLFDFRSHGESDSYHGFWGIIKGVEKDLLAVINDVKNKEWFSKSNGKIGLMGFSMGTISVVTVCPKVDEIKAAVLDCGPFISVKNIFTKTLSRTVKYHRFLVKDIFVIFIRLMLGRGGKYIKKSIISISPKALLFIQGQKDFIIPPEQTKELYDYSAKEPKEYWMVPKSYHLTAHTLYPELYETRVVNFFSKYLGKS